VSRALREILRELVLPVLERHGATRAFAQIDRIAAERASVRRALGRGDDRSTAWPFRDSPKQGRLRELEVLDAENTRLAIGLDAAVKSLPLLAPVVAVERIVRRALANPEIGVAESDAFARNLESLADEVVATWLPDVPLARVRRDLRDPRVRAASGARRDGPREDARLGWATASTAELLACAAATLADVRDPSDAARLRAFGAVPPVGIAIAASAAAGALRPNLDEVDPVFRPDGTIGSVRTLRNRALLLAGLAALRTAVDEAFPGVRGMLHDEPETPRADGPYRRVAPEDAHERSMGRLGATIDRTRFDDARGAALDAALELELMSRLVYGDVFERTPLAKCMAEDDLYEPGDERRRRLERASTRLAECHDALLAVVVAARRHHAPCGIRDALVGVLGSASSPPTRPSLVHCVEAAEGLRAWCKGRPEIAPAARRMIRALQKLARERLDALSAGQKVAPAGPILALCRDVAATLADVVVGAPRDSELLLEELGRPLLAPTRAY
jgi:hypothetical protein